MHLPTHLFPHTHTHTHTHTRARARARAPCVFYGLADIDVNIMEAVFSFKMLFSVRRQHCRTAQDHNVK
jgi:hypothetical protein